jgi:lipoprotein-anchoring transpeptidase ErfK/SrfK
MSMGQHARARGRAEQWRIVGRTIGIWAAVIVLGAVALGSGAALGQFTPLRADQSAAASTIAPSPSPTPTATEPVVETAPPPQRSKPRKDSLPAGESPVSIATVYPRPDEKFGVGVVIRVQFSAPVPESVRTILERTARVTTNKPIGLGMWSWPDDYTMIYRPAEFWPAHTNVQLKASWVKDGLATYDPSRSFQIGREQILSIRYGTQMGTLYRNGKLIREVPVSLGKPTWETASGIKTIMERYYVKRMVNPGPREPYDVQVPFALRITPNGEYLHAAPWNTYNLGVAATSHGCTNMTMEDGEWFYENALEGDPVLTFGTGREVAWDQGPGASWNIDWADWQANSTALP